MLVLFKMSSVSLFRNIAQKYNILGKCFLFILDITVGMENVPKI
jgi:hypothetical protein